MNTDSYYEIGHSHTVCEDYAFSGKLNDNLSHAIVCDGCSASPHVDVGARVLAHSAKDHLNIFRGSKEFANVSAHNLGVSIIFSARNLVSSLGLPFTSLDSTLLIAFSDGDLTTGMIYGDGGIITKRKNSDCLTYTSVEFKSGAPYYLSYNLDSARKENYKNEFCEELIVSHSTIRNGEMYSDQEDIIVENIDNLYKEASFVTVGLEFIALVSDGIGTYEENGTKEKVELPKMIEEFVNYKTLKGQFVERRMKRIRKDCEKENITHYDDISCACIHMGD